jgi:hypothetical protein
MLWFNSDSYESREEFELIGLMLGVAIFNSIIIGTYIYIGLLFPCLSMFIYVCTFFHQNQYIHDFIGLMLGAAIFNSIIIGTYMYNSYYHSYFLYLCLYGWSA